MGQRRDADQVLVEDHRPRHRDQERRDRAEQPRPEFVQMLDERHSCFGVVSTGAGGGIASASNACSPSLRPFLNSFKPDPTERISWGISWAPNSSRTTTATSTTWVALIMAIIWGIETSLIHRQSTPFCLSNSAVVRQNKR